MGIKTICRHYGFDRISKLVEKITGEYPFDVDHAVVCMIGYDKSLLLKMIG